MSAFSERPIEDIPEQYLNPLTRKDEGEGNRVNGKEWKMKKDAFRIKSLGVRKLSTWEDREAKRAKDEQYKHRLKELKTTKSDEKQRVIDERKKRLEAKAEKERFERIAKKMSAKKIERLKRKEKRNKLLRER